MSVVDVDTIGFDDFFELVDERLSGGFDSKNVEGLGHIVGVGFDWIDEIMAETGSEIVALGFEDDVFVVLFVLFVDGLAWVDVED